MQQVRVPIGGLTAVFGELLGGETWNVVAGRFGVVASMDGG